MKLFNLAAALPLVALFVLLALPEFQWYAPTFHFYVVSAASLLSAVVCVVLALSARSIKETRILFLVLSFFSLALIFSVHGLTTPGHLYHHVTGALTRSPFVSTLAAASFAALSVLSSPGPLERIRATVPLLTFGAFAALIVTYFGVSLAFPNWLADFPTTEVWFRYLLAVITVSLFLLAAWRYYQAFLLARLNAQLGMVLGLVLLAEAQLSLTLGEPWYWSWWEYHALFLAAFLAVLAGWAWESIRAGSIEAIAEALLMRDAMAQLNRGRHHSLVRLADEIEAHDIAVFGHVSRVATYALLIGKELGLPPQALRRLVLAAQMHDIGKISLPLGILNKPGRLTAEEFEQMKAHALKGWEIAQRVPALRDMAHIIRHHHEHFDGRGYPDGLKGEEIPLESRIIAAADTFDAITSQRPYRQAMTVEGAVAEIRRVAGSQLDPRCGQALLSVLQHSKIEALSSPASGSEPAGRWKRSHHVATAPGGWRADAGPRS